MEDFTENGEPPEVLFLIFLASHFQLSPYSCDCHFINGKKQQIDGSFRKPSYSTQIVGYGVTRFLNALVLARQDPKAS
jgi:hypothetical protein